MDRQPLATVAIPAGLVLALLGLAGISLTTEQADALVYILTAAAPVISAVATWLIGRGKVTPVADPRDADGTPLVRAPAGD